MKKRVGLLYIGSAIELRDSRRLDDRYRLGEPGESSFFFKACLMEVEKIREMGQRQHMKDLQHVALSGKQ